MNQSSPNSVSDYALTRLRRCLPTGMIGAWWWIVPIAAICLGLWWGGEAWTLRLRYDRMAISQEHEYWRLLTGHLVHADTRHLMLNLLGLLLTAELCRDTYLPRAWIWIALGALLSMDLGFWFLMPQLEWYVGLSGWMHGLLAAAALAWWRVEAPWRAAIFTLILCCKLGWEQWQGALPLAGELPVVVNAHLYGAMGGLAVGALMLWRGATLATR